jgi:hypothetical protein
VSEKAIPAFGDTIMKKNDAGHAPRDTEEFNALDVATRLGAQAVIATYLARQHPLDWFDQEQWNLNGVEIIVRRVGNRTGVPADATTYHYTMKGADFEAEIRSVWHQGLMLKPLETHTRIVAITPASDAVRRAFNRWLSSLS